MNSIVQVFAHLPLFRMALVSKYGTIVDNLKKIIADIYADNGSTVADPKDLKNAVAKTNCLFEGNE